MFEKGWLNTTLCIVEIPAISCVIPCSSRLGKQHYNIMRRSKWSKEWRKDPGLSSSTMWNNHKLTVRRNSLINTFIRIINVSCFTKSMVYGSVSSICYIFCQSRSNEWSLSKFWENSNTGVLPVIIFTKVLSFFNSWARNVLIDVLNSGPWNIWADVVCLICFKVMVDICTVAFQESCLDTLVAYWHGFIIHSRINKYRSIL